MYKIAVVEDDNTIRSELHLVLANHGYEVCDIVDFTNVVNQLKEIKPHIVLLDINLPGEDGLKICMKLRAFSDVPVIFVTSRDTDIDELQSLMMGGDDFITKPYNISILLTRIAVLLKRVYKDENQLVLEHKGITLNIETGRLIKDGLEAELTKSEMRILAYLFRHVGKIVPRADLIDHLWDNEMFVDDNTLSVNITRIRNKLEGIGVYHLIETKHRRGYYIDKD
ncbi:response regulator transcription factor [Mobilitalea sibirica]|uniref:Stage 0 sporulation protein A homolog n=1 Tax=Mobilitalea sibirica TaxID=1462919 RepID=A0A8J7HAW7_9FIRM|nr:response regulator transcription factor [Mobilitalea sibirica]MBH1939307.1 response regulator transcription factor [Mobilitalea sibirica]